MVKLLDYRKRWAEIETIIHVEFQTTHDSSVPLRMLEYHGKLRARYPDLPVVSIVVYLMPVPPPDGDDEASAATSSRSDSRHTSRR